MMKMNNELHVSILKDALTAFIETVLHQRGSMKSKLSAEQMSEVNENSHC